LSGSRVRQEPEVLRDELIYRGRRVTLVKRLVRFGDRVLEREVVRFGEAAAALPILPDGRVVLVRQFRAPIKGWILEIPAGVVEPGEEPEETVRRELVEEVGYEAGFVEEMLRIHTTPGYSDEVLHIFLAKDLRYVGARPEAYEILEPVVMGVEEALEEVLKAPVADSKTVLALLTYLSRRRLRGARG